MGLLGYASIAIVLIAGAALLRRKTNSTIRPRSGSSNGDGTMVWIPTDTNTHRDGAPETATSDGGDSSGGDGGGGGGD